MNAVRICRERHVDPVVDNQRHIERRQRRLEGAHLFDHAGGVTHLVAQLHKRCAAGRNRTGEIDQIMASGVLRIDDGVETKVGLLHGDYANGWRSTWSLRCSPGWVGMRAITYPLKRRNLLARQ